MILIALLVILLGFINMSTNFLYLPYYFILLPFITYFLISNETKNTIIKDGYQEINDNINKDKPL